MDERRPIGGVKRRQHVGERFRQERPHAPHQLGAFRRRLHQHAPAVVGIAAAAHQLLALELGHRAAHARRLLLQLLRQFELAVRRPLHALQDLQLDHRVPVRLQPFAGGAPKYPPRARDEPGQVLRVTHPIIVLTMIVSTMILAAGSPQDA